ncbi:claudin-18 isoform X1 [Pogona vitticeps]
MSTTMCQAMGFFVSSLGFAGCIVATAMDAWSTQDLYDNPVTAVFQYQGLWRSCVSQSSGLTECRPYFTILGLPAMFQAVRALMIVGIVLGAFGLLVAIISLKCLRMGNMEDSAKGKMTLTAGIMCIVGGLCAICGVSVFANMLVTNFWMSTAGMYQQGMMQTLTTRYTFGAALFVGWVAGGLALVGGIMLCIACRGLVPEETHYKAVSYKSAGYRSGTAYEPKKTAIIDTNTVKSDEGRRSKYDYV